jgi:macrolide-specific efflux system membrane fusion protein
MNRVHRFRCRCRLRTRALAVLFGFTAVVCESPATAQPAKDGMLGVLTPQREVALEPSIEGQLVEVRVRIGDVVAEGDLIASLDDEGWRRDSEAAEARLEAAEAEQQAATTRLRIASDSLARQRALLEQEAVSREAVRNAEQAVELATAELDQSSALVRQQRAAVEQYRVRLRRAQLRAPFAGTIAERYGNPGMSVGPGTPIVRLISGEMLWARFAAPVELAEELSVGRKIHVVVVDLGRTMTGTISQVGAEVDPASGMIIAEAAIVLPQDWTGPPLSGQTVRVRLSD